LRFQPMSKVHKQEPQQLNNGVANHGHCRKYRVCFSFSFAWQWLCGYWKARRVVGNKYPVSRWEKVAKIGPMCLLSDGEKSIHK
jgi:hypothetical protein